MRTRTKAVAAAIAASGALAVGAPLTASAAAAPGVSIGGGAADEFLESGVNGNAMNKVNQATEIVEEKVLGGSGLPVGGLGLG